MVELRHSCSLGNGLVDRIAHTPKPHDNDNPLWAGPCGAGDLGGITQSMIVRFLSCRERFRLKYVLGLEPHDRWNHRLGYGNMWHACEEAEADGKPWQGKLSRHLEEQLTKYPMQRDEITKWVNVCCVQFPEYVKYWDQHLDVRGRTPLLQEDTFDCPYELPSGRVVRLRGKWDSVDLIDAHTDEQGNHFPRGVWLQENKTKGDIDKIQVERQLKFDLQTMLYLVCLQEWCEKAEPDGPLLGVRYNVVRRPLSGGKGSIKQSEGTKGAKCTKCKGEGKLLDKGKPYTFYNPCDKCHGNGRIGAKPAETDEAFYERLRRDYIAAEPDYWFFRVKAGVGQRDLEIFRDSFLDPFLEQLCWWYDEVTGGEYADAQDGKIGVAIREYGYPPTNYRTPFGVYSALEEGGATEYDAFLDTRSEAGLRRVDELFPELK